MNQLEPTTDAVHRSGPPSPDADSPPADGQRIIEDVACTLCGCVCDDLTVTVDDNRIVAVQRACSLAEPWFESLHACQALVESLGVARVESKTVQYTQAVHAAARLLSDASSPLVYGLSRSSTDGQRAAARLADLLGGTIDTAASRCHAPSIMALQQVGESTCSLGEVRNRCDLVIFWGSNPVESHPRHGERYSVEPRGMFVPAGRADRYVVVVDTESTATSREADCLVCVEPGRDFEVLWTLRALVQGHDVSWPAAAIPSLQQLKELAERMKACRSGIIFFGLGLTRGDVPHATVEALLRLVTDLNAHTRFYARRMRVPGDVAGADSVLCWQTGFPFSVNLARGYPRYNPGEYSANELLERSEVDACLIVGSESTHRLSPAALRSLQRIPTIVLDYPSETCRFEPTVVIRTAIYGVHARGTAYRMDETPIPLTQFLTSDLPTDGDVLRSIARQLAPAAIRSPRTARVQLPVPQAPAL